jgi:N-acetylmuramoyl-L-alanine amidase
MIIGIDPGHGGIDPGAVGPTGVREADITLEISLLLADKLRERGHSVVLTRLEDDAISLRDRVELLNNAGCDLVLSIHINAFDNPDPDYISAWICGTGGQAEKIANVLIPALTEATGWPDGGVRLKGFYVLRKTDAPAVLLELGFISNPEQEQKLIETYLQANIAQTITDVFS